MPPSNSHGDWPFVRPPERVPEVPVVSREHLPQLEIIHEVLPSRRDEAHFLGGIWRLITPKLWKFKRVLAATQEVPRHTRLHSRGSTRVPPTSRGDAVLVSKLDMRDPFPAWSGNKTRHSARISRGSALHRKGERNSRVVPPFTESPRCLSPFQSKLVFLHCLEFHGEDRLKPRWHVG